MFSMDGAFFSPRTSRKYVYDPSGAGLDLAHATGHLARGRYRRCPAGRAIAEPAIPGSKSSSGASRKENNEVPRHLNADGAGCREPKDANGAAMAHVVRDPGASRWITLSLLTLLTPGMSSGQRARSAPCSFSNHQNMMDQLGVKPSGRDPTRTTSPPSMKRKQIPTRTACPTCCG